jgi:hypothetical protein
MTKRRLVWIACLVALILALPALPPAYYAVLGRLRHEPFFRGLPASYWGLVVRSWCSSGKKEKRFPYVGPLLSRFGFGGRPAVHCRYPEAVPVQLALLRDDNRDVREEAAQALTLHQPDVPLMRGLMAALDDPNPRCSEAASGVLRAFPPWSKEDVFYPNATVLEGLADSDPRIRRWAAAALGLPTADADLTVRLLLAALRDANLDVRHEVAERLKRIDRLQRAEAATLRADGARLLQELHETPRAAGEGPSP